MFLQQIFSSLFLSHSLSLSVSLSLSLFTPLSVSTFLLPFSDAGSAAISAPGRLEVEDIVARAGDSAPTQEPAVR